VKKQKNDMSKNINNDEAENSFKVKKHELSYYVVKEFSYYVVNLNVDFYEVNFYNQENRKSNINFVDTHITMIQCYNCHQFFNIKNVLFHHLHSESFKIAHCSNKKIKTTLLLTAMLVKSSDEKLLKIVLMSVIIKNIKTNYDFQN